MGRVHIPFRFGEACGLSAGAIRQLAQEARKLAIDLDDPLEGDPKDLHIHNALKAFGGRFARSSEEDVPLSEQLSLEVWGEHDFVLHDGTSGLAGNHTLHCFALFGSFILHYHISAKEKWTAEDGSAIGMQWARFGEAPRAMKGLAANEAYLFAQEMVAPKEAVEDAISRFGEKDFWLAFHTNMRKSQAFQRARNLGLIAPAEEVPA